MFSILAQADPTAPPAADPVAATPAQQVTDSPEFGKLLERLDLDTTITDTPWTGWMILLIAIFLGLLIGKVLHLAARGLAKRSENRGWQLYGTIFASAAGPVYLWVLAAALAIGLAPVSLSDPVRDFAKGVLKLLIIIAIGWFLFEVVAVVDLVLRRFIRHGGSALETQIVPLVRKTLRLFLVVIFILFTAQNVFGADIGAWLAGLGIAGLAVSLAAQDSIKNLFGSLTIFLDKPFAVGERIVFDGHDGNVEEIGFRSTKVRTLQGEFVTIPNARMVDASVKNIGRRPFIQRIAIINLTYDTPPEKMQLALSIVREIVTLPEIAKGFNLEKNPPRAYFDELASASLNLKVYLWYFPGSDWWGYSEMLQQFNFEVLRRFNEAGLEFAFPTQTLYLAGDPNRPLNVGVERSQAEQ
ncbi:MAG TPA: mechanosensitive ion channel family protein [Tepidisphaeraceae bacterium]|jgi:MscS family membrane protein|nr:mechanosensitive ion channel family protein [Tepidisphaeraceae bacterium]